MRANMVAVVNVLLLVSNAAGQRLADFPADQFGNVILQKPQTGLETMRFPDQPQMEPMRLIDQDSNYWRYARPVGRLDMRKRKDGSNVTCVGTASIISDEYLLTNSHCVPGQRGEKVHEVLFRAGFLGLAQHGEAFTVDPNPVEFDSELDYAILRVHGNPAALYGTIPLRIRDPKRDEALFIIHHPGGDPQQLTRRNCQMHDLKRTDIGHTCDTRPGSSGAPVFSMDGYLVGLHYAGGLGYDPQSYNSAKRMTKVLSDSHFLRSLASKPRHPKPPPKSTRSTKKPKASDVLTRAMWDALRAKTGSSTSSSNVVTINGGRGSSTTGSTVVIVNGKRIIPGTKVVINGKTVAKMYEDKEYTNKSFGNLVGIVYRNCKFVNSSFTNGNVAGTTFHDCVFVKCSFANANLAATDLSRSSLRQCSFQGANLAATDLSGANLHQCSFQEANLVLTNFRGATQT